MEDTRMKTVEELLEENLEVIGRTETILRETIADLRRRVVEQFPTDLIRYVQQVEQELSACLHRKKYFELQLSLRREIPGPL